jgi:tetratricopeptide (TPR) repeat protein
VRDLRADYHAAHGATALTTDGELQRLGRAAVQLEHAGRFDEAVVAYQRLLARFPDLPDTWFNLAVLQRRLRQFDAALASYRQALDRGVAQPEEAHLNRAVIYSDVLRQEATAVAELQAALALNPRYVPALLNLANLHEDLGHRDEGAALYERALVIDPQCHSALARLAALRTSTGPDADILQRVRTSLARNDIAPADRASLGFVLGTALEKAGAYDESFAAVVEANRQSRLSAGPAGARYDRARQERFVDELIAAFPAPVGKTPTTGNQTQPAGIAPAMQPIFVCGMFRSGSTLVEQILAGHPRIAAGGEIDFLPTIVRTELAPFPASMSGFTPQQAADLAARYRELLTRLHPGVERVVDKRPDNFLYLGLIKTLFPDARIVHTTRDPLDVCLSVFFLHLDHQMPYALDLLDIGHYYGQYRRLMAHWHSLYGDDIIDIHYDELVREPRPVVERMLASCGLDWDDACMDFHERANAVKTASVWQVRQPLYQHASGRARNFARHLEALSTYLDQTTAR